MPTADDYPTKQPLPPFTDEEIGYGGKPSAVAKEIPWIDMHQHTQTLTWEQHEKLDLTGARAVVMIAASYFQLPYRPIPADDWRALWDHALLRSHEINRNHFFDVYLATGIHMGTRVADVDELLEVLPEYCALEETVAIGETGVDPSNRGGDAGLWPMDEQKRVVREQMRIASEFDIPVLIHTPKNEVPQAGNVPIQFGVTGHHKFGGGEPHARPQFEDMEGAKLEGVEINVELLHESGLREDLLVLQHADDTITEYVLEETDCYLSFSLIRSKEEIFPELIAETIEAFGPDQIMLDTDMLNGLYADDAAFTMKRMILDLLRLGVDPDDVRQVVYENQLDVLGLEYEE